MAEPFCGQIGVFGFNYAPVDWALCDGSSLPVQQFQALAAIIGTAFGGNQSNFKVPDLRGWGILGVGNGDAGYQAVYPSKVGHQTNNLTYNNLPAHSHALNAAAAPGNPTLAPTPAGNLPAQGYYSTGLATQRSRNIYAAPATGNSVPMASNMITPTGNATPVGAVNNQQPYLPLYMAICVYGNWPSRP